MSTRLFGTDGIRGRVNEFPITAEVALRAGKAVAQVLRSPSPEGNRVVVGKDTRLSGYMIESALVSGLPPWAWMCSSSARCPPPLSPC